MGRDAGCPTASRGSKRKTEDAGPAVKRPRHDLLPGHDAAACVPDPVDEGAVCAIRDRIYVPYNSQRNLGPIPKFRIPHKQYVQRLQHALGRTINMSMSHPQLRDFFVEPSQYQLQGDPSKAIYHPVTDILPVVLADGREGVIKVVGGAYPSHTAFTELVLQVAAWQAVGHGVVEIQGYTLVQHRDANDTYYQSRLGLMMVRMRKTVETWSAERIAQGVPLPRPLRSLLIKMLSMTATIKAQHARGILHEDLHWGNSFLEDDDGPIKLADYGRSNMEPGEDDDTLESHTYTKAGRPGWTQEIADKDGMVKRHPGMDIRPLGYRALQEISSAVLGKPSPWPEKHLDPFWQTTLHAVARICALPCAGDRLTAEELHNVLLEIDTEDRHLKAPHLLSLPDPEQLKPAQQAEEQHEQQVQNKQAEASSDAPQHAAAAQEPSAMPSATADVVALAKDLWDLPAMRPIGLVPGDWDQSGLDAEMAVWETDLLKNCELYASSIDATPAAMVECIIAEALPAFAAETLRAPLAQQLEQRHRVTSEQLEQTLTLLSCIHMWALQRGGTVAEAWNIAAQQWYQPADPLTQPMLHLAQQRQQQLGDLQQHPFLWPINKAGETVLHVLVRMGYMALVPSLLSMMCVEHEKLPAAAVLAVDKVSQQVLHVAVKLYSSDAPELLRLLVAVVKDAYDSDPQGLAVALSTPDEAGNTPLALARQRALDLFDTDPSTDPVRLLCNHGAEPRHQALQLHIQDLPEIKQPLDPQLLQLLAVPRPSAQSLYNTGGVQPLCAYVAAVKALMPTDLVNVDREALLQRVLSLQLPLYAYELLTPVYNAAQQQEDFAGLEEHVRVLTLVDCFVRGLAAQWSGGGVPMVLLQAWFKALGTDRHPLLCRDQLKRGLLHAAAAGGPLLQRLWRLLLEHGHEVKAAALTMEDERKYLPLDTALASGNESSMEGALLLARAMAGLSSDPQQRARLFSKQTEAGWTCLLLLGEHCLGWQGQAARKVQQLMCFLIRQGADPTAVQGTGRFSMSLLHKMVLRGEEALGAWLRKQCPEVVAIKNQVLETADDMRQALQTKSQVQQHIKPLA